MTDGFLMEMAIALVPSIRLMQSYDVQLKDVKWFNMEPYPLDMAFIVQSDKSVWDAQVDHIVSNITEEVIDDAFTRFPTEINQETIKEIKQKLLGRLSNLQDISDRYYTHMNKFAVIKGTNKDDYFDINLFPSKLRITVQDKDIQVWAGNKDYPVLDYKNFIVADTYKTSISDYDRPKIKIGKLSPTDDTSLFGYTQLRFIAGGTYNPNSKKVLNLHNSWRFPSAGGTRILTFHNGTLYAICDGLNTNRFSDNPDDRQIKIFSYSPEKEIWVKENSSFERKIQTNTGDILGIVRALTANSFDNAFYLSGQYSSIKYNQNR
jgi:hypothetical protein